MRDAERQGHSQGRTGSMQPPPRTPGKPGAQETHWPETQAWGPAPGPAARGPNAKGQGSQLWCHGPWVPARDPGLGSPVLNSEIWQCQKRCVGMKMIPSVSLLSFYPLCLLGNVICCHIHIYIYVYIHMCIHMAVACWFLYVRLFPVVLSNSYASTCPVAVQFSQMSHAGFSQCYVRALACVARGLPSV